MSRPPVDLVVPFAGSPEQARALIDALGAVEREPGDSLVVADNRPGAVDWEAAGAAAARVLVVAAPDEHSSYYARNVGAGLGDAGWIVFIDSDCRPDPGLLRRMFEPEPAPGTALLAGGVRSTTDLLDAAPAAVRWSASRGHIDETAHLEGGPAPAGVTANLAVRRDAFEFVGGFEQGIRSGGDLDLCWRLAELGHGLEHRPEAFVTHSDPDSVSRLLEKARRHAAGRAWNNRRRPGALARPRILRPFVLGPAAILVLYATGERERARMKAIDIRWSAAMLRGYYLGSNEAERPG